MSMQINAQAAARSSFASAISADRTGNSQARRDSFQQLSQALQSGDLDSARSAYAGLVKNAPAAASWRPDSPFAQLGKALVKGDMSAAQTSFDAMAVNRMKAHAAELPPIEATPTAASSSTGGTSGTTLNLVA